jgi:hypothetical protein
VGDGVPLSDGVTVPLTLGVPDEVPLPLGVPVEEAPLDREDVADIVPLTVPLRLTVPLGVTVGVGDIPPTVPLTLDDTVPLTLDVSVTVPLNDGVPVTVVDTLLV